MQRCVIVGGAAIEDYKAVLSHIRQDDFLIYCDSGLRHLDALGHAPGLIVGDFDSHEDPHMDTETIVLPREKDDTDTVFAVKEAIRRGFREFLLIGVVGARLDHTLGNVAVLFYLDSRDMRGTILDDYSEIEAVSPGRPAQISEDFAFFSLLNVTGRAEHIRVTGAKYPLEDAEIGCEYPYGVSNEVLPGQTASVSVGCGRLLLVKIRRKDGI